MNTKTSTNKPQIVVTRYGNTVHIHGTSKAVMKLVNKDIAKALDAGDSHKLNDGSRQFITYDAIQNVSDNSYIWDKSGDRVKHNKVRHTVTKDGKHTTKIIGTSFRNLV